MRKLLLNPTPLFRKLRQLSLLLSLLLALPQTAWGEGYFGINTTNKETHVVESYEVTDATAADILGDGSHKITYDATSNILTLNGVDLEFIGTDAAFIAMVDGDLQSLTVRLIGENKLTLGGSTYLFYGTNVSFITSATASGSLTITTADGWTGFKEYYSGNGVGVAYCDKLRMVHTDGQTTYTIQTVEPTGTDYGLTVAGTPVTSSNATDVLGNGKVSFDATTTPKKLSFTGRNYINYPGHCINTSETLEIGVEASGNLYLNSTGDGNYPFYSASDVQIQFSSDFDANIQGKNVPAFSPKCVPYFPVYSPNSTQTGPQIVYSDNGYTIKKYSGTEFLEFQIDGNYITSDNKSNILGDGSVSFADGTGSGTLTLNNANIGEVRYSGDYANLTINLTGTNYITKRFLDSFLLCYYGPSTTNPTLTFTGDGELRLQTDDANFTSADYDFVVDENGGTGDNVDYSANFTTGGWSKEYISAANSANGVPYLRIYKGTSTAYGLTIAGTAVTSANAANILAGDPTNDGKISFTPASNTLTLNGVTITPEGDAYGIKYTGTDNLSINLNGTNIVKGSGGCPAIGFYDNGSQTTTTPNLTFINGGTEPCSLQLEATTTPTIEGFGSVINTGLYKIEETITGNEGNTYKTTITSTILGGGSGSPDDPFIIATAADLKDFSSYVNKGWITTNGKYFKLSPSSGSTIDCNGLTGFEPIGKDSNKPFQGTFDGDNKMIKGLSVTYSSGKNVGLIGSLDGGTITQLILDGCTIIGGSSKTDDNYIGGIVGYVSNNGTVSKCKVQNESTISCNADSNSPIVGGIVGYLDGGTITECLFQGTSINAVNTAVGAATSGSIADAGGVVGKASGTVSNCQVKGAAEISAIYSITSNTNTGAIIGEMFTVTLSNNTYDYSVKTKVQNSTITELTTYSGYTQRGIGKDVYAPATNVDITESNGAVMYTKIVSLPTVNSAGTVAGVDGTYYKVDGTSLYVAPGQKAKIDATPNTANNFALAWLQAVKTGTADVVICDSTNIANGGRQYTFTMPDAEVTVNVSWDELYNLWIGDTQVTSANAAHILGENNTTVTFTAADPNLQTSANTLTLNGATLTVPVKVGLASLTIDIQGNNTITVPDGNVIKKPSTTTTGLNLTLKTSTADGKLTLTSTSNETIESGGVFSDGFNINIDKSIGLIQPTNSYNLTNGSAEYHVVRFAPSLGVSIGDGYGGTIVITDDNATDVLGDGKVIFKKNSKTLTLNGATLSGAISTSLSELNIDLVGKNSIISYSDGHVIETPYNDDATVNIKSTAQEKGGLTMTLYYSNDGRMVSDHVNLVTAEPLTILSGSLTGNDGNNNSVIIGEDYKLDVAGTKVTYLNKDNILGDTEISVTFTPSNNTLTLNEATINGSIDYNGSEVLTIALNGTNSVTKTSGTYAIYTNGGNFIFVKGEGATSVSLTAECGDGYHSISFGSINLSSGLYWKPIAKNKKIITDDPDFVLVGGYVINDGETKTGKAGTSGTIAYAVNGSEKTLTFTNYQNTFGDDGYGPVNAIETGVVGLKVVLIGDNSITCDDPNTYAFKGIHDDASIQFVKGGDGCKLAMNMNTTVNPFSFGNGKVTYDHLVYSDGNGMLISEPTPPTMVYNDQEKVVLEKGYTDGNIYYTIEYADGKTTGVTGATYSEPFAMKAPGTVTAWVVANEAKTAEVKGKHFGYESKTFTMKSGETKAVVLAPAIEASDNIALADNPYASDAEGVATLSDAVINAVGIGKANLSTTLANTNAQEHTVILNKDNKFTIEVNVGAIMEGITFAPNMLYATYCNTTNKNMTVPEGLKAYAITGVNGNVVTLSQVEFLPKVNGTTYFPLLLKREDKNTEVGLSLEYDGTASAPTSNYLRYAISNVQTTGVEFVLYKDEFVKATGTILEQKCYLYLSGVSFTRGAYDIGDGTTAIDATLIDNEETNDYWYDLQGRRIQKPSKAGLYIKNGKKVIVNTK